MSNLVLDALQTVINATTSIWYGTSDTIERGRVIASLQSTPPFVIVHPDDVVSLPTGARHLRDYRPTQAEMALEAEKWLNGQLNEPIAYQEPTPKFRIRRPW